MTPPADKKNGAAKATKAAPPEVVVVDAAPPPPASAPLIQVRATIALPKLGAGSLAWVDPAIPYIQVCLENGYLVRVEG